MTCNRPKAHDWNETTTLESARDTDSQEVSDITFSYASVIVGAVIEIIVGEIVSALIGAAVAITLMTIRKRDNKIQNSKATHVGDVIKAVSDLKHCSSHSLALERKGRKIAVRENESRS